METRYSVHLSEARAFVNVPKYTVSSRLGERTAGAASNVAFAWSARGGCIVTAFFKVFLCVLQQCIITDAFKILPKQLLLHSTLIFYVSKLV